MKYRLGETAGGKMLLCRITLTLFTLINFKEHRNLDKLIDVFEEFPQLYPYKWARDDRAKSKRSYNRQALVDMAMSCWNMETPMLYGSKTIPYESFFSFEMNQQNPTWKYLNGIYWDLDVPEGFQDLETVFEFAHHLANAAQPEYRDMNLIWDNPKADELYSPAIKRDEFQKNGVPPLGIRTWIGAYVAAQISIKRLQSCGAILRQTDWGGFEIDLVDQPWKSNFDMLLKAKKIIMANLEPSGVFGDYSNYPLPLYSPAPSWIPIPLDK